MSMCPRPLLRLLPNRVRRNYTGGRSLDAWQDHLSPADTDRPEDWLASTTPAINPGLPIVLNEGLGRGIDAQNREYLLATLFTEHGEFYLGTEHLRHCGPHLGYLAKLLDSSMRLHTQVHPTREFAQARMGKPYGKLESYVILSTRPGSTPQLRLGFQHAPTRDEWRDIVATQNIPRMDACFAPIPVQSGEAWLVPGGMPHALGAGLLLLEVMEPSDLVVRCEFERAGIVVPLEGRYMNRDLDFCLDVFDYTQRTPGEIRDLCQLMPITFAITADYEESTLVPYARTHCFEVRCLRVSSPSNIPQPHTPRLLIVTNGTGTITCDGDTFPAAPGVSFFLAASANILEIIPDDSTPMEIHICQATA